MTPIERHLADLIDRQGPMSVAAFMSVVLGHPEHGYYSAQRPFGSEGDFITAPEISQMFGELVGLWCAQAWIDSGQPSPFNLVELGPGRGVLMADALRAIKQAAPECANAAQLHLVEASRRLRKEQKTRIGVPAQWHDHFADIPKAPTFLIANEFFDALPVHQFLRTEDGWRERYVTCHVGGDGPSFAFVEGPLITDSQVSWEASAVLGDMAEVSPASTGLMSQIAGAVVSHGGAALIIDYGHEARGGGDTLQAVRGHCYHPVLSDIGTADLTAHVRFGALAESALAAGARVFGPSAQGDFLKQLGIQERCDVLSAGRAPSIAASLREGVDRLVAREGMGTLFKVLAIADTKDWSPAGFEGA